MKLREYLSAITIILLIVSMVFTFWNYETNVKRIGELQAQNEMLLKVIENQNRSLQQSFECGE